MTISTTASRISYNGNGATTAFSFPYRFLTNADLVVIKVAADGTETTLTLNTNYTVTGADDEAGGTVTLSVAPLSGQRVVIYRAVAITQEVDYITGDPFPAETHERALDRLTMVAQQQQDAIDRSAKLSETSTADADTLIANINTLAVIEADVSAVAAIDDDVSDVAAIDANVTTVAGIAANVTTVAGIAANVTTVAGIAANVTSVAGNATNINTVAGISAAVTAVAADATDIGTVAADIADINTCADNMAAILDAPAQASAAAASAAAAAASLDNFDDRYLGSKSSAPTLDNDGNALAAGALYFNDGTIVSDDKGMYVYDGGTWIAASAASQAILVKYKYIATAGQTTFSGADANSLTLSYTAGSIIVTLNGVVMDAADYTATSGNSVVLGVAAALNDELGVFAFSTFDIANTYTQAQADAEFLRKAGEDGVTVTGGNLGLGVTPSAWSGVGSVLQVGTSAAIVGNSANSSSFISNAYYDGAAYKFIGAGYATRLALTSGAYSFQTSSTSGSAGGTVTFTTGMTLDASGNLQFNSGYGSVATAYGCRAWVNFNGTGTVAIRGSGNVSSITDLGTGYYQVNITTALPDANYATQVTASSQTAYVNDGSGAGCVNGNFTPTTSAVRVMTFLGMNSAGADNASVYTNVAIFR
jgi:hypothetical protein